MVRADARDGAAAAANANATDTGDAPNDAGSAPPNAPDDEAAAVGEPDEARHDETLNGAVAAREPLRRLYASLIDPSVGHAGRAGRLLEMDERRRRVNVVVKVQNRPVV